MEVRAEPSFNVGVQNSPPSSPFLAVQNTPAVFSDSPASQGLIANTEERMKRKRGRPRKNGAPDGSMGMLSSPPLQVAGSSSAAGLESKKKKGKHLGWGKKKQMKALGLSGIGFTPHVITVKTGEDVSAKIISFSNDGPRAVCILSANGAISNVTLRQPATSGGTITYEGRFEILSLSGSFLASESSGQRSRTGGLSVSLASSDGHVLGGGVAGLLIAATPVQVVVGSFITEGAGGGVRKAPQQIPAEGESAHGKPTQGGMPEPPSPISRGALSTSSGGGPSDGPHNQSSNGDNHDGDNNQGHPIMSW